MSKVISFRLSDKNPREARAHKILLVHIEEGYSIRHVITKALIMLDDSKLKAQPIVLDDLNKTLSLVNQLLDQIEKGSTKIITQDILTVNKVLSDNFISSISKSAKPGLKVNQK